MAARPPAARPRAGPRDRWPGRAGSSWSHPRKADPRMRTPASEGRRGAVTFDVQQLNDSLLLASAVLLVAILAVRLSAVAGLPSLLFYLALGVLLGEAGLGIAFDDASLAHALGFAALVIILTEGG